MTIAFIIFISVALLPLAVLVGILKSSSNASRTSTNFSGTNANKTEDQLGCGANQPTDGTPHDAGPNSGEIADCVSLGSVSSPATNFQHAEADDRSGADARHPNAKAGIGMANDVPPSVGALTPTPESCKTIGELNDAPACWNSIFGIKPPQPWPRK